jgi:hypothetical protein
MQMLPSRDDTRSVFLGLAKNRGGGGCVPPCAPPLLGSAPASGEVSETGHSDWTFVRIFTILCAAAICP